ncbi:hypothetical protein OPQ81_000271 [Rhizoctonia solani]|nr:hypothetical protein OPQ81_000271 [Rhizoctonia solani]
MELRIQATTLERFLNEHEVRRNVACVSGVELVLLPMDSPRLVLTLMSTRTTTTGCFVVLFAAVLALVWRRRQRWRRTRPWLAKLRAEAASKIERDSSKETSRDTIKDTAKDIIRPPKDITSDKEKPKGKMPEAKEAIGKRTKERRKRGKEPKPRTVPALPQPSPPSPRLIPLPPSPAMPPMPPSDTTPPTLVLSPTSPISITFTDLPTTPAIFPAPTNPTPNPKPKLPAFPPASPLPPNLARDGGRKDRARKPSAGPTPESTQIASLKGALEAARQREEEVAEERKAWQKKERELQTQVNQLSHQLHALTIAFATGGGQGFPPYGYGYGTAVEPCQPAPIKTEASEPPEHAAAHPRPAMYIPYPYPPFGVPPGPQHGPGMVPMPSTPMAPVPSPTPMMSPPPMTPPPAPQYLFSTQPWMMHRGPSPMHHGHGHGMNSSGGIPITSPSGIPMNPGRHFSSGSPRRGGSRPLRRQGTGTPSTPSVGSVDDSIPLPGMDSSFSACRKSSSDDWAPREEYPSIVRDHAFLNPRDDYAHSVPKDEYIPLRDDYVPLREDYVPIPPPTSGTKREREPETDDEECSLSDSDEESVIFEDGSVSDSINLSLRVGGDKDRGADVVRIQVGEQDVM